MTVNAFRKLYEILFTEVMIITKMVCSTLENISSYLNPVEPSNIQS